MKKTVLYNNNCKLSYTEYGTKDGFTILVQHGLIASIDDYHLFDRLIDLGARLICIARPGYGESTPYEMQNMAEWGEIVAVLVEKLELSQFDVLGISSGAPYSYSIGFKFPDKVRNIFILSGTPALFDENVVSHWPYPIVKNASISEMQKLAYELFFSHLSAEDLAKNDVKDSMMNNCFGIAQDLRIRVMDWGFRLSDVQANVMMRHSKSDEAVPFITAELTSKMLPNCQLEVRENDAHFSNDLLDDFIRTVMARSYSMNTI